MHILLRPVPGLSVTLERCLATFFLAAAKCANIDITISTPGNAGHHRQENGTMRHASEYGSRNLGTRRGRHAAKTRGQGSAAVARSSAGRRAPAARQGSLRAPQHAGGGTDPQQPRVGFGGIRRNRPGSGSHHTAPCCGHRCAAVLTAIVSATVRGPVACAPR